MLARGSARAAGQVVEGQRGQWPDAETPGRNGAGDVSDEAPWEPRRKCYDLITFAEQGVGLPHDPVGVPDDFWSDP